MKPIKCKMCGSNDIVKRDGIYVCNHCGTKYTVEKAEKMITETIDAGRLDNYYSIARQAVKTDNKHEGQKYYNLILKEKPNDWEANFYSTYFKTLDFKKEDIASAAISLSNCIIAVFPLIHKYVLDYEEKKRATYEVCSNSFRVSKILREAAEQRYHEMETRILRNFSRLSMDSEATLPHPNSDINIEDEKSRNISAISGICIDTCDSICDYCDDDAILAAGIPYIKERIKQGYVVPDRYISTIRMQEPEFEYKRPEVRTGGCYIATSIYGSYDCPQVWVLRRYRDYSLRTIWYGRLFVKTYYAISPSLVKWFGNKKWFKRFWKNKLDAIVRRLCSKGYASTPYEDIVW